MANADLTAERLRKALVYDSNTGVFTWNETRRGVRKGSVAGYFPTGGHVTIRVDGVNYQAHRLAWLYVNGDWPKEHIDHINGIKSDNRIKNLRDVPSGINSQNMKRGHTDSKSGMLGVSYKKELGKWVAQICCNGKQHYLGIYETPEIASEAYFKAKKHLHIGFVG